MKGYTVKDVARMLDLSESQVRLYARAGFLDPGRGPKGEYRFSFQDLVLLRTAKGLQASRLAPGRLRVLLRKLRDQLPAGHPLSSVRIQALGDRILVRRDGEIWNPESGQTEFDFEVSELAAAAAPHGKVVLQEALESADDFGADDWYEVGFELETTAPEEAREAYSLALEMDSDHIESRINLGRLLLAAGQLSAAETQFRLALSRGPHASALFHLGVVLEDLGRREEALQAYRETVDADATHADAYFNLARLLEQAGENEASALCLTKYRDLLKRKSE